MRTILLILLLNGIAAGASITWRLQEGSSAAGGPVSGYVTFDSSASPLGTYVDWNIVTPNFAYTPLTSTIGMGANPAVFSAVTFEPVSRQGAQLFLAFSSVEGGPGLADPSHLLIVSGAEFLFGQTPIAYSLAGLLKSPFATSFIELEGGTAADPTSLSQDQTSETLVGHIGGDKTEDFYQFYWSGGAFTATAMIADPNVESFIFQLAPAPPQQFPNGLGTTTLDSSNGYRGTITTKDWLEPSLPAGYYNIGVSCSLCLDPAFAIQFGSQVPEPSSGVLLASALAGICLFSRKVLKHRQLPRTLFSS